MQAAASGQLSAPHVGNGVSPMITATPLANAGKAANPNGIPAGDIESPTWGADGWPVDTVPQPPPCPKCGSLDAWQAMAGVPTLGPGGVYQNVLPAWRCIRCDPPRQSSRIKAMASDRREAAARFHDAAARRSAAASLGDKLSQPGVG